MGKDEYVRFEVMCMKLNYLHNLLLLNKYLLIIVDKQRMNAQCTVFLAATEQLYNSLCLSVGQTFFMTTWTG